MQKWRCNNCKWLGTGVQLLSAPNPFDNSMTIAGCPNCKDVGDFAHLCEVEGCEQIASAGTPTPERYRWTCHKHRPTT